MVKGLFGALGACLVLSACSGGDTPQDDAKGAVVTAADTAAAAPVSFAEARIDSFRVKFTPGDTFRYRVRQSSEAGPDSAVATSNSVHVYTKKVRAVRSDGSYEISMRFDTIRVDLVVRNRTTGAILTEQHYASTDSTQRASADYMQFNALLGEEVSLFISPKGVISQVGDVSPIVNKMLSKVGQEVPQATKDQFAEQIKQAIYASFYGQEYIPLPLAEIDSTGSWSVPSTSPIAELFAISTVASYHIDGVRTVRSRRIASITGGIKGTVNTRPLPPNAPFSVKILSSSIDGTTKSLLDVDGGYTIAKSNSVTFSVTARLDHRTAGTKNVSQTQRSRYEIELLP
jgi:hypothetical protein